MIQVKPVKTDAGRGPLTSLGFARLVGCKPETAGASAGRGPPQGDGLPESKVNSEESRDKGWQLERNPGSGDV